MFVILLTSEYLLRYCNVDYVVLSSLRKMSAIQLLVTYDIACQWATNLSVRMEDIPADLRLNLEKLQIDAAVPKFHLYAHQLKCLILYSLNYMFGVGRTDGEGIERNWARMNPVAHSTREMGPGSRHDTIDDHCGHINWRKTVDFGTFSPNLISRTLAHSTNRRNRTS